MLRNCLRVVGILFAVLFIYAGCSTTVEFESSIPLSDRWETALDGNELGGWGPVHYPMPPMDGVTVNRTSLDHGTTIDIYLPESEKGQLPVIILPRVYTRSNDMDWLGVSLLDINYLISWCRLLAGEGYAVVAMESDSPFKGFVSVIDFLRDNQRTLGVDADRMGFYAMSSNPDIVLMYLARPDLDNSGFQAGAFFYPTMEGAPFNKIDHIPYFIATGGKDDPGLNALAQKFIDKAQAEGLELELHSHPEGGHGFEALQDDETTREIISAMLVFMESNLE